MPRKRKVPIDHQRIIALLTKSGNAAEVSRLTGVHENTVRMIGRKARGRCTRCGALIAVGKTSCEKCLELDRQRIKKLRKARYHKGVCIACGKPRMLGSKHYCAKHRRAAADRTMKYMRKRNGVMNAEQKRRHTLEVFGKNGWEAWQRDGAACQVCGTVYGDEAVHVHHIDENQANNSLNNLVCLCFTCHRGVHDLLKSKNRSGLVAWFEKTYPDDRLR